MGSSEKFCLRWNDFESNISTAFRELREDKDFFDVTLVCDEDQIQAHKVILSACSPFFRSVLRRNRHEHPLLYMKGIKYVDIVSVLNFMYHGEVNVAQEELNSFLSVAEDLKVKGLTQNVSDKSPKATQSLPLHKSLPQAKELPERQKIPPYHTAAKRQRVSTLSEAPVPAQSKYQPSGYTEEMEIQEVVPIKSEPENLHTSQDSTGTIKDLDQSYGGVVADPAADDLMYAGEEYADYSHNEAEQSYDEGVMSGHAIQADVEGNKELDVLVEQMMSKSTNLGQTEYVCNVCQKVMKMRRHMMCHVETHIEGVTHVCNICSKTFKTRNSLDKHKYTYHKGEHKQLTQTNASIF